MFGRGSAQCGYQVTEDDGTKSSSEFLESASCIPRGSTDDRPWRGLGAQEGKSTVKPTVEPSPPSSGKVLNGDCPGQVKCVCAHPTINHHVLEEEIMTQKKFI